MDFVLLTFNIIIQWNIKEMSPKFFIQLVISWMSSHYVIVLIGHTYQIVWAIWLIRLNKLPKNLKLHLLSNAGFEWFERRWKIIAISRLDIMAIMCLKYQCVCNSWFYNLIEWKKTICVQDYTCIQSIRCENGINDIIAISFPEYLHIGKCFWFALASLVPLFSKQLLKYSS